jgi:hypothetical protein
MAAVMTPATATGTLALLALLGLPGGSPPPPAPPPELPPSDQAVVFYNARLSLRADRPADVLKLWLLRNSLVDQGQPGAHDGDFRSLVWAALGKLGLCPDGFPGDEGAGAGLWPLALHNWVVAALLRPVPGESPSPFDAFEVGRQQRFVSLDDVLSLPELRGTRFLPSDVCFLPRITSFRLAGTVRLDLQDRLGAGELMHRLLTFSLETLVRGKVESLAAVEARIFDLHLALAQLQTRRARQEGAAARQRARRVGVSDQAAGEVAAAAAAWPARSRQAEFLRRSLTWQASEWLTLSRSRRLSLFAQARPYAPDPEALVKLVLAIIDALCAKGATGATGDGAEVESWIGFLDAAGAPRARRALTLDPRGKRLLELQPASGFRERATIALHRGVAFLEDGHRPEALSSFGYALLHAESGREPAVVLALARRWLSYLLSRYETSEEVIATLDSLVPRREYELILEDLVWRAALRADRPSFERAIASARPGSGFAARAARLRSLARGEAGPLVTSLREAAAEEPQLTLRFVRQLLERIEGEDRDVRAGNLPLLKLLAELLESLAVAKEGRPAAQSRIARELLDRTRGILEGLHHVETSPAGKAHALSPRREAFAGNVRLAPADPLPWPFAAPAAEAPSAFVPLVLQPVEWRDGKGALVFGWRLTE